MPRGLCSKPFGAEWVLDAAAALSPGEESSDEPLVATAAAAAAAAAAATAADAVGLALALWIQGLAEAAAAPQEAVGGGGAALPVGSASPRLLAAAVAGERGACSGAAPSTSLQLTRWAMRCSPHGCLQSFVLGCAATCEVTCVDRCITGGPCEACNCALSSGGAGVSSRGLTRAANPEVDAGPFIPLAESGGEAERWSTKAAPPILAPLVHCAEEAWAPRRLADSVEAVRCSCCATAADPDARHCDATGDPAALRSPAPCRASASPGALAFFTKGKVWREVPTFPRLRRPVTGGGCMSEAIADTELPPC